MNLTHIIENVQRSVKTPAPVGQKKKKEKNKAYSYVGIKAECVKNSKVLFTYNNIDR